MIYDAFHPAGIEYRELEIEGWLPDADSGRINCQFQLTQNRHDTPKSSKQAKTRQTHQQMKNKGDQNVS